MISNLIWSPAYSSYAGFKQINKILDDDKQKKVLGIALTVLTSTAIAVATYIIEKKANKLAFLAFEHFFKIGVAGENSELAYAIFSATVYKFFIHQYISQLLSSIETPIYEELARYINTSLNEKVNDKIYSDTEQNLIKLTSNKKTNTSSLDIDKRLFNLTLSSITTLSGSIKTVIQAGIGLYSIRNIGAKYIFAPLLLGIAYNLISASIHEARQRSIDQATDSTTRQTELKASAKDAAKPLHAAGGYSEIRKQNKEFTDQTNTHNRSASFYSFVDTALSTLVEVASIAICYKTFGFALYNGDMKPEDKSTVELGFEKIKALFMYSNTVSKETHGINSDISKINEVLETMERPTRVAFNRKFEGNKLVINNLFFEAATNENEPTKKLKVEIKNATLKPGNRCIITGGSGKGKTTLMSLLYGFDTPEHINSLKGSIIFPKTCESNPHKIAYISQKDFTVPNLNFKQLAYLGVPDDKKNDELLEKLVREAGLSHLKNTENLSGISGGEKARIRLISTILSKPDVLFLDEAFNGLDQKTSRIMRNMIEHYLRTSIVLSVMHPEQGVDASYGGFYTHAMDFNSFTIQASEITQQRPRSRSFG